MARRVAVRLEVVDRDGRIRRYVRSPPPVASPAGAAVLWAILLALGAGVFSCGYWFG